MRGWKYFLQVRNKGRRSFVELGHFDKHFVKHARIKTSAGKHFGDFSPRYSQNYILNAEFDPKMGTITILLPKTRALIYIFQPPPHLNARLFCDVNRLCNHSVLFRWRSLGEKIVLLYS